MSHLRRPRAAPDDAVSAVISVILMVAVTVVLAAAVYVWVGSVSGGASAAPVGSIALQGNGNIVNAGPGDFLKSYVVSAANANIRYADFTVTLDGAPLAPDLGAACSPGATGQWSACAGTAPRTAQSALSAGDELTIRSATDPDGATLRFIDPASNAVLLSVPIR